VVQAALSWFALVEHIHNLANPPADQLLPRQCPEEEERSGAGGTSAEANADASDIPGCCAADAACIYSSGSHEQPPILIRTTI
jgi:hypothetical protein